MSFNQKTFAPVGAHSSDTPNLFSYKTNDLLSEVIQPDYFIKKSGQLEVGDFILIQADDHSGFAEVNATKSGVTLMLNQNPKTAFGDLKAEAMSPVTQVSAEYGLLNQVLTTVDSASSGITSVVDNKFTCQTGVAADGLSSILSLRQLNYRPGQGSIGRLTAVFDAGVDNSQQAAGLITSENVFAFGYIGSNFGIIHGHDGESESQELTITTSATGSENATITIDGTGYTVPLTLGTAQHNAFEIAISLGNQVPNYSFTSNNDQVVGQALISGPQDSFLFSSATAVAAWEQKVAGVDININFIAQSNWNTDTRISSDSEINLNPLKGNVYQIQYQYLGFGAIKFFVEDSASGDFILVHTIKYANKETIPSVTKPAFRIGWIARNLGNTTNLTLSGSSLAGFVEGKIKKTSSIRSEDNNQLAVSSTLTNIITFRNRINFGGKVNRSEVVPLLATLSTQTNKFAFFQILASPTFAGDLNFQYVDKDNSIMEFATDSVAVSGGIKVGGITVVAGSSEVLMFNERANLDFVALPGQTFTIAAVIPTGSSADCQATGSWQEDL